jgi:ubiquitin-protein ligase
MITKAEKMLCHRRVAKEYLDLKSCPLPNLKVEHRESDHLDWYCVIHDLADEEFLGGEYILNIKLSPRYPFEAPDFYLLTPNGRFETNQKLCFSNSSFHQESWSPIWNIKSLMLGFLSVFLEKSSTGVGHMLSTNEVKIQFACKSKQYNAEQHASIMELFK